MVSNEGCVRNSRPFDSGNRKLHPMRESGGVFVEGSTTDGSARGGRISESGIVGIREMTVKPTRAKHPMEIFAQTGRLENAMLQETAITTINMADRFTFRRMPR